MVATRGDIKEVDTVSEQDGCKSNGIFGSPGCGKRSSSKSLAEILRQGVKQKLIVQSGARTEGKVASGITARHRVGGQR